MPMPVLPAVPSTTTPPGRKAPCATASLIIAKAARSLTDPPGFMNSALPRIVHPVASEAARSLMRGVRPIAATTSRTGFIEVLWVESAKGRRGRGLRQASALAMKRRDPGGREVFFVCSKIFWMFASPINLLLFGALAGVLLCFGRRARFGRGLALTAILILAPAAPFPLGVLLIAPIEDRFPLPPPDLPPPEGIIVLG